MLDIKFGQRKTTNGCFLFWGNLGRKKKGHDGTDPKGRHRQTIRKVLQTANKKKTASSPKKIRKKLFCQKLSKLRECGHSTFAFEPFRDLSLEITDATDNLEEPLAPGVPKDWRKELLKGQGQKIHSKGIHFISFSPQIFDQISPFPSILVFEKRKRRLGGHVEALHRA